MAGLLEVELRLLLLRYTKEQIADALASIERTTLKSVTDDLAELEHKHKRNRKARKAESSLLEVIDADFGDLGEVTSILRTLVARFNTGAFLPHLRDVQRFLDRIGGISTTVRFRSRKTAGRTLLQALSQLSADELQKLVERQQPSDSGDLAILSRAIMGRSRETERS